MLYACLVNRARPTASIPDNIISQWSAPPPGKTVIARRRDFYSLVTSRPAAVRSLRSAPDVLNNNDIITDTIYYYNNTSLRPQYTEGSSCPLIFRVLRFG